MQMDLEKSAQLSHTVKFVPLWNGVVIRHSFIARPCI